jgi:hypothetical protein
VYADWLEERGDPRSEFLRVQSEVRRLLEEEQRKAPLWARGWTRSARLGELRTVLDPIWLARLHETKVPLHPRRFTAMLADWRRRLGGPGAPLVTRISDSWYRKQFRTLVREIVAAYLQGDINQCEAMRALLRRSPGVRGVLFSVPNSDWRKPVAVRLLRFRLALLSLRDQGEDVRDEMFTLDEVLAAATRARVDPRPHLEEVAAISSPVDRMGMGSMQELFRRAARRYAVRRRAAVSAGQGEAT